MLAHSRPLWLDFPQADLNYAALRRTHARVTVAPLTTRGYEFSKGRSSGHGFRNQQCSGTGSRELAIAVQNQLVTGRLVGKPYLTGLGKGCP